MAERAGQQRGRRAIRLVFLAVSVALGVATKPALAADNHSPYEVDWRVEPALTAGFFIAAGAPRLLLSETLRPWCGLECDPERVNGFDRPAVELYSTAAKSASDSLLTVGVLYPHLLGLVDAATSDPTDGWEGWAVDSFVLVQTTAVTLGLTNMIDLIFRRPRPLVYNAEAPDEVRLDGVASLSYVSGHTSVTFAMATAYGRLYMQRHPDSRAVVPVWVGGYALATTTGVLRVVAGQHFPSDVLGGAAEGICLGLLIPWLHERDVGSFLAGSTRLRLWPAGYEGGGGLTLTMEGR